MKKMALASLFASVVGLVQSAEYRLDFTEPDRGVGLPVAYEVGDVIRLDFPESRVFVLEIVERLPRGIGGESFLAKFLGGDSVRCAELVTSSDGVRISAKDPATGVGYIVTGDARRTRIRKIDPAEARPRRPLPPCPALPPSDAVPVASEERAASKGSTTTYVDILTAYDCWAYDWAVENGGITNFAMAAVAKMNTALANTGLDASFRFRLVGVVCVDDGGYGFDGTLGLASGRYSYQRYPEWKVIKDARDACGADIVTIFIDNGYAYGTTGLGYSLGAGQSIASFENSAYNVCSVRSVEISHTMTHEVGHNMGCGHSGEQAVQKGPQRGDYAQGYYFVTPEGGKCHTIMAYDDKDDTGTDLWTEIPYFSSPSHSYEGVTVGDWNHDNTRVLRETFYDVSRFRTSLVPEITQGEKTVPPPVWYYSRADAISAASSAGKRVVLVYGRDTCGNTSDVRGYFNRNESVKELVNSGFVCWYCNCDGPAKREGSAYFSGSITLPLVVVLDPARPGTPLVRHTAWMSANELLALLFTCFNGYEMSYELDGGSFADDAPKYMLMGDWQALAAPARQGYIFDGWTAPSGLDPSCAVVTVDYANAWQWSGPEVNVGARLSGFGFSNLARQGGRVTLRAHWRHTGYTITYLLNGGALSADAPTSARMNEWKTLHAPTRPGCVFGGWRAVSGLDDTCAVVTIDFRQAYQWWPASTAIVAAGIDGFGFSNLSRDGGEVVLEALWARIR